MPTKSRNFILLAQDCTTRDALELLRSSPGYVIVRRRIDSDSTYFLYLRKDFEERLEGKPESDSLETVLGLEDSVPAQLLSPNQLKSAVPGQIVISDGRPTAFYPRNYREKRNLTSVTSLGTDIEVLPFFGDPKAKFIGMKTPDKLMLEGQASIIVTIGSDSSGNALAVTLAPGSDGQLLLRVDSGLEIVGDSQISFTISGSEAKQIRKFDVRAKEIGDHNVDLTVCHQGAVLGVLRATISVVLPTAFKNSKLIESAQTMSIPKRAPDLSLMIFESKSSAGETILDFRITAPFIKNGPNLKHFGPVTLNKDAATYFNDQFNDIDKWSIETPDDVEDCDTKLRSKGVSMFQKLLPSDLQNSLWELKSQIRSVLIQSEEPWIPWELCRFVRSENRRSIEGDYFCEAFEITRWIPGISQQTDLSFKQSGIVVPQGSGLSFAQEEKKNMTELISAPNQLHEIKPNFRSVYKALEQGQYNLLHFACHGKYDKERPDAPKLILDDSTWMMPENISGTASTLGAASPLVFMNCCQLGRSSMSLSGVGGWASAFLNAGAAAFVGAYWMVYDETACLFAKTFYARLLQGDTVGQATKAARMTAKTMGDPTWLAYTVFADPSAALIKD